MLDTWTTIFQKSCPFIQCLKLPPHYPGSCWPDMGHARKVYAARSCIQKTQESSTLTRSGCILA